MITFEDFKKVEITVGKILSAEKVPEAEKLLRLQVDFGPSPLEKGVAHSDEPRVVNTPPADLPAEASAQAGDGSAPLVRGDTTPALADSALPLRKGGEGGEEIPPPADGVLPFTKGESDRDIRQIISGIALHFPESRTLVGKKCMFVTNIEPRMIKGLESNGMILAASTADGEFSLLEPSSDIPEGTRAK